MLGIFHRFVAKLRGSTFFGAEGLNSKGARKLKISLKEERKFSVSIDECDSSRKSGADLG